MWRKQIEDAHQLIKSEISETPLEYSKPLSALTGSEVFLKLENYQLSGSFKIRGVMNKLLALPDSELSRGLVACSTGNHGAAFAYAVDKFGHSGLLFLPENVSKAKLEPIKSYDIDLEFFGNDCLATEQQAGNYAKEHDKVLVHPYNDLKIIAGQGTIAAEIVRQLGTPPDSIIAPVGGGGLISGVGAYMKSLGTTKVMGCQPKNSAVMYESLKAGKILDLASKPTLSDATAGGVEFGSATFPICQQVIDKIYLLDETHISESIKLLAETHQMMTEGAAAMTVATLIQNPDDFKGKSVVLIISGKKISFEQFLSCLK